MTATLKSLTLIPLSNQNAIHLYNLIQKNKHHLTQHGDFFDYINQSLQDIQTTLEKQNEQNFCIMFEQNIVGSISLTLYEPNIYGIGYWLDEQFVGKGLMKNAVAKCIDYAKELGAIEIWAGVSHPNIASQMMLKSLGFTLQREQSSHLSYCLKI